MNTPAPLVQDNLTARRRAAGQRQGAATVAREQEFSLQFLASFAREPLRVGSLWPSSRVLSRAVVDSCDIKAGAMVVELGPGTGAFTGLLLNRVSNRGRLLAVEINSQNAAILRQRFPRCEVVHGSAEDLPNHLGGRRASCIVSGLAWGNMLPRTQNRIFEAMMDSLTPNGQFVAFAYAHAAWFPTSLRFRRRLSTHFKRVETTPIIWRNLPPAYIFRCWRA